MRRILFVLIAILVLCGAAAVALHFYLRSDAATQQVAERLESLYGGQVEVGGIAVGLHDSAVEHLKLFDKPRAGAQPHPWLDVKSARADVSIWQMLRGEVTPRHITLDGPTVILQFDRDGRLRTQLPDLGGQQHSNMEKLLDSVPELELVDGEIIIQKEGHPDLVAKHVNGRLSRRGHDLVLTGSADNDVAGKLALAGQLDPASDLLTVDLKTEKAAVVDQAFLERVPFVPALVWEEIHVKRTESTADLKVTYNLKKNEVHFRLELAPRATEASIPSLDVVAHDAQGSVVVEDEIVHIRNASGKTFSGSITLDGDLDFSGPFDRFDFSKIVVKGLDVSKLPPSWKFPPQIKGKLYGTASAHVTMKHGPFKPAAIGELLGMLAGPGAFAWRSSATTFVALPKAQFHADGKGKGEIRDARVNGFPTEGPVGIRWRPEGFETDGAAATTSDSSAAARFLLLVATGTAVVAQEESQPTLLHYPLRVVESVLDGVRKVSRQVADTVDLVAHRVPKALKPAAPEEKTSYIDVNLKLKDVDLGQFVAKAGLKLPFAVAGKVSFQVKASLPLNRATDMRAYKATGKAEVRDLQLDNAHLAEAEAEVAYANGVLTLTTLQGRFPGTGSFQGSARMQVVPSGDITANLTLDRVPLQAVPLAGAEKLALGGAISGSFALSIPAGKLKSGVAWDANGNLTSARVAALGLEMTDLAALLRLKFGVLSLTKFRGRFEGAPLSAEGRLVISAPYPLSAHLLLEQWNISVLDHLSPQFRLPVALAGQFTTTAEVSGTLEPFNLTVAGDADAKGLKVDTFTVRDAKAHWETDTKQLRLSNINTQLYGGAVTGKATLPLENTEGGSLALHLDKIDIKELAKALPVPFRLEGQVQGDVKAVIPPAGAGKQRTATASVALTAPKLRVQNIPAEKLQATIQYQKGLLDYKLQGSTLGGTFDLEGQVPALTQPAVKENSKEGHLRIKGIELGRLAGALHIKPLAALGGRASLDVDFTHSAASHLPNGSGLLRLSGLTWQGAPIADNIQGRVSVTDGLVRLTDLAGLIAQGTFRAQVGYDLLHPNRRWFTLSLDNVNVARFLGLAGERVPIEGMLSARVHGKLGMEWHGAADIEFSRGKVYGLDVSQWRLPISWRYAPSQGRGQLNVYETSGHVARGRATARLNLTWDVTAQVDGQVRFFDIDVQNLLRETTGSVQLGSGHMSGRFDFAGHEVRSLNDLAGTLTASFGQTQALQLPLLRDIAPYLGVGPPTTFQKGTLAGRLDRGVFRVKYLTLEGGTVDIFAHGTVALSGALNLELIAKTGFVGLPSLPLRILGLRLPVAGPVPLGLLQEVSNVLSNRVLYVHITGTIRNPSIRPEPLPILTQEAVRYFIYRAAGI
jgi:translocation and assembly module TamB